MRRPAGIDIEIPLSEKDVVGYSTKYAPQISSKYFAPPKSTTNASISSSKYIDSIMSSVRNSLNREGKIVKQKESNHYGMRDLKQPRGSGMDMVKGKIELERKKHNLKKWDSAELVSKKPNTTKHTMQKFDFGSDGTAYSGKDKIVSMIDDRVLMKNLVDKVEKSIQKNINGCSNLTSKTTQLLKEKLNSKALGSVQNIGKVTKVVNESERKVILHPGSDLNGVAPRTSPNALGKTRELFSSKNVQSPKPGENFKDTAKRINKEVLQVFNKKPELNINTEFSFTEKIPHDVKHKTGTPCNRNMKIDTITQNKFFENNAKPNTTTHMSSKKITFDFNTEAVTRNSNYNLRSPKSQKIEPQIRYEIVPNWRVFCYKLRDLEIFLSSFLDSVEKSRNPYEIIRQYVDFIQETTFNDVIELVNNTRYQKIITQSFILERWAIFAVFYLTLEHGIKHSRKIILRLALTIYQNFIFYLKFLYGERHHFSNKEELKVFKDFLDESILPKNADFYAFRINKVELLEFVDKANCEVKDFLASIVSMTSETIANSILHLLNTIEEENLGDNLGFLLDSFCDYFVKRGVVTVEYHSKPLELQNKQKFMKGPFIKKQIHETREYTLVLDLDETLVHYDQKNTKNQVLLRPHVHRFLDEMSKYFEIIVFTAAQQDYADWVIDRLDKNKNISFRLYRQHTYFFDNANIKDLDKVGRDIRKTIIVDNIAENFQLQNDNGIFVKSWFNDPSDTVLLKLIPYLRG